MMKLVILVACLVALGHTASEPAKQVYKCFNKKGYRKLQDILGNSLPAESYAECKKRCKGNGGCQAFIYVYNENSSGYKMCSLLKVRVEATSDQLSESPTDVVTNMKCD